MIIEDQKITITWNKATKKRFTEKGYVFTNYGDTFEVDISDISIHSKYKIAYICDYCGKRNTAQYYAYTAHRSKLQKDCCNDCKNIKAFEVFQSKIKKDTYLQIMDSAKKMNYKLITPETEYQGIRSHIEYICPKHGIQSGYADSFKRGHGCKKCQAESAIVRMRFTPQQVKEIIESKNGNILLNPEDYIKNDIPNLKVKCACGNVFTVRLSVYENQFRCSECSGAESNGEYLVRKYLEKNNIEFIPQYTFKDCRDKLPLPFDFYLPKINTCLEYDGQQHEKPRFGKLDFTKLIYHDGIKNEYCKNNGIRLIRINYKDYKNIDEILDKELELCK